MIPLPKGDANVAVFAALSRAIRQSAFPLERWNELQAANPGGDHNRYRSGDLVPPVDLQLAASADRLLALVPGEYWTAPSAACEPGWIAAAKCIRLWPPTAAERVAAPAPSGKPPDDYGGDDDSMFQLSGAVWRLKYARQQVEFPHHARSGLLYIRELIRNKGRHVLAVDLAAVATGGRGGPASHGFPILDRKARLAYRARYSDLQADLEAAKQNNDDGRAALACKEIDELASELRSAIGLGGRDRRVGDEVDRAKRRVSMAINRSIERIRKQIPDLALHLRNSLQLGRLMIYQPEAEISWVT